ncbi:MAG: DUF169 domain-containing protein [Acidimicrobiales bacterium]
MTSTDWVGLDAALTAALHPTAPPIAITFGAEPPAGVARHDGPMPDPLPDGRTGRVPAGCVFWMQAVDATFTTVAEDHGNCSVGSMTHGFATLDDVAGNDDVATLLGSGWVTTDDVPQIPVVTERPGAVTYGPLRDTPVDPDVILVRLTPRSLMVLSDALPGLRVEGKPQCHIVAVAKERQEVAASVGCMLSRVRTGMPSTETTCAIPASKLAHVVAAVQATAAIDARVAAYAAKDARRFETAGNASG